VSIPHPAHSVPSVAIPPVAIPSVSIPTVSLPSVATDDISVVAQPALSARRADRADLGGLLRDARADTLALFDTLREQLPELRVPLHPNLNPPLWELGHVGWFQELWIERNPHQTQGLKAPWRNADWMRTYPARRANADALYNSVQVVHSSRWDLQLPGIEQTLDDLAKQIDHSLARLQNSPDDDFGLYFHRLSVFHEDMHHEAGLYMAQALGVQVTDVRWQPQPLAELNPSIHLRARDWVLGSGNLTGFAFDNELAGETVTMAACEIDAQVVSWGSFLPFVEQGGYQCADYWDEAGLAWLQRSGLQMPLVLRRKGASGLWQRLLYGQWQTLQLQEPAVHLTAHEARAWCAWAGRRLPTEAEWECAACTQGAGFRWGDVWEWTASDHRAFPGFEPHPYRDYSAPFFDGRPVLRGGSFMTQPRMKHPRYRNFFAAHRNDVAAGFRSCAC